jgi:di/tricarboxylate transporter
VTPSVLLVLAIVAAAVILFVTEWLRYDVVAIMVLLALTLAGLITHEQALAGFSNEAVVTIAAVLVLSGGLARTGVANLVGRRVLRLAGGNPVRLIAVIMITAGVLSGIMNDIAVAALMLPVVVDIARRTHQPASKLLIPLSFAALLGGMTTLIGTAPNILISGAVGDAGLRPFRMFDFTPVGATVLLAGIGYMVVAGRRLLPTRVREEAPELGVDLHAAYELQECLFSVTLPPGSPLDGRTLVESRLGLALGLNALAVMRDGQRILAPPPDLPLRAGDRVVVEGRREPLEALQSWKRLAQTGQRLPMIQDLVSGSIGLAELELRGGTSLVDETLAEANFRTRYHVHVLAITRDEVIQRTHLQDEPLAEGDVLLVLGRISQLELLRSASEFTNVNLLSSAEAATRFEVDRRLLRLTVPPDSLLARKTLAESRLGDAFHLIVLEIVRGRDTRMLPSPEDKILAGDTLLIQGRQEDLTILDGLQDLVIASETPSLEELESRTVGLAEVTLSPRTSLVGSTLHNLRFREKYGLGVLAIWRGRRAYHSNVRIRDMKLEFGDALLVYGARERLATLAPDPDFLVLSEEAREAFREERAPVAAAIMASVIGVVSLGWLPIYIMAPVGAVLMVLTGCLPLDEVYRTIEWKVIMLIAGMLGLGAAMQETGAADLIATNVLVTVGELGTLPLVAGLFLITALSAQVMPTAAVAVLMSPIALNTAADLALSPYALMMVVAVGASCAFISPFGHAVNLLVMGAGGYRVADYAKVGVPMVLVILVVVLFVLPLVWPLTP